MPLTPFQREIARLLAAHRNPDSHVAGGAVINRADTSYRYSSDLDIFHDIAESVAASAERDFETLATAGFAVDWLLRLEGFFRAQLKRGDDELRLDWACDTAFRFFPVAPDLDFGYALHPADLAANKVLALAGRTELRDFLDVLYLDAEYLSLGAAVWAACGKDAGYTPALLLDLANRHASFREGDLLAESLARPLDPKELKQNWLLARERAELLIGKLPAQELGCLYLDADNHPVTPNPDDPSFPKLIRHYGCVRGAWPRLTNGGKQ